MTEYDLTIKDFEVGDRVEAHPATNAWMTGDRFGTVEKIGVKYVHVLMDKSEKVKKFIPENLGKLSNTDVIAGYDETVPVDNPVIGGKTFFPAPAKVFGVAGIRVSTRSSKSWKRKLAKKLARQMEESQNGP